MLSAAFDPVTHALTVSGSALNDTINVSQSLGLLSVTENGVLTFSGSAASVTSLTVRGNAGNDTIDYSTGTLNAYLYGNDGNDVIRGGSGNDYIDGWTGDDSVYGGNGDDVLYGYTGNDRLDGWNGNDRLYGEDGNDVLLGYYGADNLFGGAGNDSIYGEGDNDVADGGDGSDNVYGGAGNDNLSGNGGTDNLFGDAGDDVLDGGVGGVAVYAQNTGDDKLHGGLGNDVLHASDYGNNVLHGDAGNDYCYGYGGADVVYGDDGDDYVSGGDNNDRVYGGAGNDAMHGGNGDDVLVSIDNATGDALYGEGGYDSFWLDETQILFITLSDNVADASLYESLTSVHRVRSFANGADRTLDGDNIADPTDSGTRANFSDRPLFATDGPSKDDIYQGSVGDCYFLATLSAVAKTDANRIRQSVVDLGDGTYGVQMVRGGVTSFVRVDGDLPVNASGNLVYAKLGHQNSNWAAIMEKAWAFSRTGANTYASTNSGWMSEVFTALGSSSTSADTFSTGTSLLSYIQGELAAGKAVTFATLNVPAGCPCIGSHAYMVERVNYGWVFSGGLLSWQPVSVTLRNPWGYDGAGSDSNTADGYVTISGAQALGALWKVQSAYV